MGVEDTSQRPAELHLLGMLGEGQTGYIQNMEAAGQQQLVASELIPTECPVDELTATGFVLGEPVDGDPLFRHATLPEGWHREGSDHAMWSYIVDRHSRRRVAIFFKAAFYDRRAFARVETPWGYLWNLLHGDGQPVLDDEWLTPAVADATLAELRDRARNEATEARNLALKPATDTDYWTERAVAHDTEASKAEAMRQAIAAKAARRG